MNKIQLEERLIAFAASIIGAVENMPNTRAANHLAGQLLRSGTSPALNYGEAQSGESRKDFVHKVKIVLKELRETFVCLRIIERSKIYGDNKGLEVLMKENNELISIFVKSAITADRNLAESKISNR